MRKANKIMMMTVSILLSLVLITSSVMSSTLAKYVTAGSASSNTARVAKWGIAISTAKTNLSSVYKKDNEIVVQSSASMNPRTGLLAPGTRGALTYFSISGDPEVSYKLDFSGEIAIGEGFSTIVDEIGRTIDYFPIAIYLCRYDYDANGNETKTVVSKHCVVRLTPDSDPDMTPKLADDQDESWDGKWRMSFFESSGNASKRWAVIDNMVGGLNSSNSSHGYSLNNAFDVNKGATESINSIYAVEWEWAYQMSPTSPSGINTGNAQKGEGDNTYHYQTRELDTQLGEMMLESPERFQISLSFSVSVTQTGPATQNN